MTTEGNNFHEYDASDPSNIIDHLNVGVWTHNTCTDDLKWSAGLYYLLGYKAGEIVCSCKFFIQRLLHPDDKAAFLSMIQVGPGKAPGVGRVRLLTKSSGYVWFEGTSKNWETNNCAQTTGTFVNIKEGKPLQIQSATDNSLLNQHLFNIPLNGFEIAIPGMELSLSAEAFAIYELNTFLKLTTEEAISFFEPPFRPLLTEAIEDAVKNCKPFELELLFRTAKNNVIWVSAKGLPLADDFGNCIKIRGTLSNIDQTKKKTLGLQSAVHLLNEQNRRLQDFGFMASHNLRSHTGNLQFMVNLFEETTSEDIRAEVFSHIKLISDSMVNTIEHLNEIVQIYTEADSQRKTIQFETIFKNVIAPFQREITRINAKIEYDFSDCPSISYIPAYLESIMQNLLTNSLKYRHQERQTIFRCRSFKEANRVYMTFEDNGIGIDLKRHGDKIFGMYKTFHENHDAKGIGLFITRNQVEYLGGSIKVDSTVDVGTKFTIRFA